MGEYYTELDLVGDRNANIYINYTKSKKTIKNYC